MTNPPQGDPRTDAELISSVRSGDPSAFGALYARHAEAVRAVAGYYTTDPATADDLTSDAFERMLGMLKGGRGPDLAFRAYIYTIVRRLAFEHTDRGRRTQLTDDFAPFDGTGPIVDPADGTFEQRMVSQAFTSLPERWQAVLWYVEVEGMRPAEVGVILGLSANGVSALAYRAREALRSAYLQAHVSTNDVRRRCADVRGRLGAWVAGSLSGRDAARVAAHVEDCDECTAIVAELRDTSHGLKAVLAPLILGGAAAAFSALASPSVPASAAPAGVGVTVVPRPPRDGSTATGIAAIGAAAAAVVGAIAVAGLLVAPSGSGTLADPLQPTEPAEVSTAPVPTRTPTAKPTPRPVDTPAPKVPGSGGKESPAPSSPQLALAFADLGDLVRGRDGMVGVEVSSTASTVAPTVNLDLPPGVSFDPLRPALLPTGWACAPLPDGDVSCAGPSVGEAPTSLAVPVSVAADAASTGATTATVKAPGSLPTSARTSIAIADQGLGTRFVADGSYSTALAGSSFVTCDPAAPGCAAASAFEGHGNRWNNEDWVLALRGRDDHIASSASVSYPGERTVAFAALYWSGPTPPGVDDAQLGSIELVSPTGAISPVAASRVVRGTAIGTERYQAFADVTSIVANGGPGVWSAQDPVLGTEVVATPGSSIAPGAHAGWALVVVYADPTAPPRRVSVLDGVETAARETVSFALAAGAPGRLDVGMVVWEGDAGNAGDSVSLDGLPLPRSGSSDSTNTFRSRADGADVVNTFGVDVGWFEPRQIESGRTRLDVTSTGDTVMVGAVITLASRTS